MLSRLSIQNMAIIESLDVSFDRGMSVLTGETGAGKSIVVGALELIAGARASSEFIRAGADAATITGIFDIPPDDPALGVLEEAGIPSEDALIIRRVISRDGRNRAFVNDTQATVGLLQRLRERLFEVIGQHEHLALLRPDAHRSLIDTWGDYGSELATMRETVGAWREARHARRELEERAAARGERIDFLRFQKEELESLAPTRGEMDEIESKLNRVRNLEKLRETTHASAQALYDSDHAAVELIGRACAALGKAVALDEALAPHLERLDEAEAIVSDVARELSQYAEALGDDDDLDQLEGRHEQLRRATRKHGTDGDGLVDKLAEISGELDDLENAEENIERLKKREEQARRRAIEVADTLDDLRRAASERLFGAVESSLRDLGMPHAVLELRVERREGEDALTEHGASDVEVRFSANPGEPPRSLARVASGGELSRLMLAFKLAMVETERAQSYLFDEVDTGVGGNTADAMARMLADLARSKQLFVITHLPQVACYADAHYTVTKEIESGRTYSRIRRLSEETRAAELARMLGGAAGSDATLRHAKEMLSTARRGA